MKRIILFRFPWQFEKTTLNICENRIKLLRELNPKIKIYGYIGNSQSTLQLKQLRNFQFEKILFINNKEPYWFHKNSDLAARLWFKRFGHSIKFDVLHIVEWDLLLLDSFDNLYETISKNYMGLTAIKFLSNVKNRWYWTTREPYITEWKQLLNFVRKNFHYNKEPYVCLGPGPSLPRNFLENYSKIAVPELCHDEMRLPLFGQIFNLKLSDTGFAKRWFDKREYKYFNCESKEIAISTIKDELNRNSGRRAFHPFRKFFDLKLLEITSD